MSAHLPYISQFESSALASEFLEGRLETTEDPNWRNSGWTRPRDYGFWAWHTCGVACLRMILPPGAATAAELTSDLVRAGAYQVSGQHVTGLIYHPFADYIRSRWGLSGTVHRTLGMERVRDALGRPDTVMMLSVNPAIRNVTTDDPPPSGLAPGGHLVLATKASAEDITFHDPSGHPYRQSNVTLSWEHFGPHFAGRGIEITVQRAPHRNQPLDRVSLLGHAPLKVHVAISSTCNTP